MDTKEITSLIDTDKISEIGTTVFVSYLPKLASALVILILGWWLIGLITRAITKFFERKNYDETLETFLTSFANVLLKILLIITVAGMIGVEMTSFIAMLGAAGLAVGMALQGTLQNFAGGVIILAFRPFKVGDFIEAQGFSGTVREIQIFNTILKTIDNKTVIIPNSPLATESLVNYSSERNRRLDLVFGIGYQDDIDKAKSVLEQLAKEDQRVLEHPQPPFIAVGELADSSVNLVMRLWVKQDDYWQLKFDITEAVKKSFDAQGISIPFPQRDVHLYQINQD